jgi:hypothetical protein
VGYIATDGFAQPTDQFASSWNFTARSQWNHGEVLNGIPDNVGHYAYTLSVVTNVTISVTCTNARVYGLPGPTLPIKKAMGQATATQQRFS